MFISLPLCSGALKCKGKTLLITLLLKDQQPGEMYFVTFSLWSLFFRNENSDIRSGLRASAWRWGFNESLLPFPWAPSWGRSRSPSGAGWLPPELQIELLGQCILVSHLASSGSDQIRPTLRLSHIDDIGEDARANQWLKGKSLMWDFLLVGEQRVLVLQKKRGVWNKGKKCLFV